MEEQIIKRITDFIFIEDEPAKADIIFIPGNGFPQPSERAAELYGMGMAPWILPSGRYSKLKGCFEGVAEKSEQYQGNYQTEWDFMKRVLISRKVPEEAILREDQATYTYDNAIRSRQVTDEKGFVIKKAMISCINYHARRALMYYTLEYPEAEIFVCPSVTEEITRENWYKSEMGVRLVMGEMERCATQFYGMLK